MKEITTILTVRTDAETWTVRADPGRQVGLEVVDAFFARKLEIELESERERRILAEAELRCMKLAGLMAGFPNETSSPEIPDNSLKDSLGAEYPEGFPRPNCICDRCGLEHDAPGTDDDHARRLAADLKRKDDVSEGHYSELSAALALFPRMARQALLKNARIVTGAASCCAVLVCPARDAVCPTPAACKLGCTYQGEPK